MSKVKKLHAGSELHLIILIKSVILPAINQQ